MDALATDIIDTGPATGGFTAGRAHTMSDISNRYHYRIVYSTYMTERQSAPATVSEAAWLVAFLPPNLKPGLIVTAIFSGVANG